MSFLSTYSINGSAFSGSPFEYSFSLAMRDQRYASSVRSSKSNLFSRYILIILRFSLINIPSSSTIHSFRFEIERDLHVTNLTNTKNKSTYDTIYCITNHSITYCIWYSFVIINKRFVCKNNNCFFSRIRFCSCALRSSSVGLIRCLIAHRATMTIYSAVGDSGRCWRWSSAIHLISNMTAMLATQSLVNEQRALPKEVHIHHACHNVNSAQFFPIQPHPHAP